MEQVLYSLPDGWEWLGFDSLVENLDGKRIPIKTSERSKDNAIYPYYGATGIIDYVDDYIYEGEKLLISEDGANLVARKYPIAFLADGKYWVNNHAHVVDAYKDKTSNKYLSYFFAVLDLSSFITGSAQPKLSQKKLNSIKVAVAPIAEQKRIVEKLDALLTRIDTAIEHLQESVTLADALYASELNAVFPSDADIESLTDKDGWVSLSDTCTFENGDRGKNYPSKSAFVAEGIPVVSAGNLGERYIDHKGLNYITPERYDLLRSGRIRIGDILFCLRGSLGKVAISKDIDEGVIASSLVIIRPKDRVSAEYIYKYLKSSLCQKFISYYNNGAAQPNLSAKSLGKFMLPLPNAEHQKLIVDGLDEKYQLNQKLLDGLNSKIISLQSLKESILDSAFKGEL